MKTGLITKADGSAYLEQERIKMVSAVYGPQQFKKATSFHSSGRVNCEVKYASFALKQRYSHNREIIEKNMSMHLEAAISPSIQLDIFPKSIIHVHVFVLEADGESSTFAAAITCASAAIADASIECVDLVTGSAAVINKENCLVMDPTDDDEIEKMFSIVIGYMAVRDELTELWSYGLGLNSIDESKMDHIINNCISMALDYRFVLNNAIMQTLEERLRLNELMQK
ncbi:hypothetical protein T552_02289 [Pneumocystis carinii B80]|uniref:Exoribonuclease phosphorolytic domain-containing protein n=1 Tax=Pneumocystis carinii (strain B80) TaxID=1408658 RepID=A0A0W4ZG01_PNEC8|nr:hypothetical protein T552_02289 [Pneumocystis carinii B80]KTW27307.1 hypothetical protein T552_02289 [Pneumocystis carinii B80]